jgi:hypothetical protein
MAIALTRSTTPQPPQILHDRFHSQLARFNQQRFSPATPEGDLTAEMELEYEMRISERNFVERERRAVAPTAEQAPVEATQFTAWLDDLRATASTQDEVLYPWLAEHSTLDDLRWFISQEAMGDPGFGDLMAMTRVTLPPRAKLAVAYNEATGDERIAARWVLREIVAALFLSPDIDDTVWESLALANLMTALAANRRYVYQSVGALAIAEATAPQRARWITQGLRRLGALPASSTLGERSTRADVSAPVLWTRAVLEKLLEADPKAYCYLAEGALMRLYSASQCLLRYRNQFVPTN